jgi:hypothetical protein
VEHTANRFGGTNVPKCVSSTLPVCHLSVVSASCLCLPPLPRLSLSTCTPFSPAPTCPIRLTLVPLCRRVLDSIDMAKGFGLDTPILGRLLSPSA